MRPHQDHFGLIEALKLDVPVYSKNLINSTRMLLGTGLLKNEIHYFKAWQSFVIGDFPSVINNAVATPWHVKSE